MARPQRKIMIYNNRHSQEKKFSIVGPELQIIPGLKYESSVRWARWAFFMTGIHFVRCLATFSYGNGNTDIVLKFV